MKNLKKSSKDHLITYGILLLVYIVAEILMKTGNMSSLMQGILVPVCVYSLVAIGLNLCVGYLGELSLGHAGFMCVGALCGAYTTKMLQGTINHEILLFTIALVVGV